MCRRALVLLALHAIPAAAATDWTQVDAVLNTAIKNKVFPGCSASVIDKSGALVYGKGFGSYTYGEPTPHGDDPVVDFEKSLFDMASLSKIIGPTSTAAFLYQQGLLSLDTLVSDHSLLGPAFAANGKQGITITHLLQHNAGFPPDPVPGYGAVAFACPATVANVTHPALDFSCSEKIFAAMLAQDLDRTPGAGYVYSDLSMITMLFALGSLISKNDLVSPSQFLPACGAAPAPGLLLQCSYEAYWRLHVRPLLGMSTSAQYILDPASQWGLALPTWQDDDYRHAQLQGVVSDENSYAAGGLAGHAGVWCSGADASAFMATWRVGPVGGLLNATTVARWTAVVNASFSHRALGWDTQANSDTYRGCGAMSNLTAYHTGYTGTELCYDTVSNISTVLLTHRVYPVKLANSDAILAARRAFNTAVVAALAASSE